MKTLVTGATGFIGSAVVRRLLARDREVTCLVEPGAPRQNLEGLDVEIVEGDIGDRRAVAAAIDGCRVLYHLAAIYRLWLPDNRLMYEVNVEGTKNVLFAAMKAGLDKVVHTSSISTIGLPTAGALADESCAFNFWDQANHYIRSKWLSERDALRFADEGLPLVVVNPAFPFGSRDIAPTPTGRFVLEALQGNVPGYLAGGFNAVDVDDLAEGHVLAEERGRVGEKYILGGHNVTYKEFYEAVTDLGDCAPVTRKIPAPLFWGIGWVMERVADRTHEPPQLTYKAARYGTRQLWFDTRKARTELGMPRTPLRETIAKSVEWFRSAGYV